MLKVMADIRAITAGAGMNNKAELVADVALRVGFDIDGHIFRLPDDRGLGL